MPTTSSTTTSDSSISRRQPSSDESSPFVHDHGRRFLRDAATYPLPVDLAELHRQSLRTAMLIEVFGAPFSAKLRRPPEQILELVCGSATWSLRCDQYLKKRGYSNVSFVGLDIAPLAPDLKRHGVQWRFVQHDLRKVPLPFGEEFDLIMVSDATMVTPSAKDVQSNPLVGLKKYLRPGGCIEVIETDYVFRCLQPEPSQPPGTASGDVIQARKTATYTVGPATPFSKSQNQLISDYNRWAEKALQARDFTVTPCAAMSFGLSAEQFGYEEVRSRRVAIPFSDLRWENDVEEASNISANDNNTTVNDGRRIGKPKGLTRSSMPDKIYSPLNSNQAAIRQTALNVAVGLIESLEHLLIKESGKKKDEWDRWWAALMLSLFEKNDLINGECIEAGVWWARKEQEDEGTDTASESSQE